MQEQTFFSDPAIDKMMNMVLALGSELHITRMRNSALEGLLVRNGTISKDDLENWTPDATEQAAVSKDLQSLVLNIFGTIAGEVAKPTMPEAN